MTLQHQTPQLQLIINYASQQDVPITANAMQFSDITDFMSSHYDSTQFIAVRERYKFWSTIKRKSVETSTELTARIRHMTTTCDFPAIKNPLDEAMQTCFICTINNEVILISPCSGRRKRSWRMRRPWKSRRKWKKQPIQPKPRST